MKKQFKSILALLMLAVGMTMTFVACSDDDDDNIDVSGAFTTALKQAYPNAKNVEWEKKGVYRVAEFEQNFVDYDIWFDHSAKIVMSVFDYGKDLFLVPDNAVNAAFAESEYGTVWQLDDIKHYKQLTNEFYVFEVEKNGQPDMDVYYNVAGELIKAVQSDKTPDILPETQI